MTTILKTPENQREYSIKKTLRAGFSMIEIMIVLTIIGMLFYFMVPKIMNMVESAKRRTTKLKIGAIKNAILMYKTDTAQYPEKLKDLMKRPTDEKVSKKWEGPYIDQEDQLVDSWGEMFKYQKTQTGYDLYSYGPNQRDATKDEYIRAD